MKFRLVFLMGVLATGCMAQQQTGPPNSCSSPCTVGILQPATDSTDAVQITKANGTTCILCVDTITPQVRIAYDATHYAYFHESRGSFLFATTGGPLQIGAETENPIIIDTLGLVLIGDYQSHGNSTTLVLDDPNKKLSYTGGTMLVGTTTVAASGALAQVAGPGIQIGGAAQPSCDATHRGMIQYTAAGTGVIDTSAVCTKDAADVYAWRYTVSSTLSGLVRGGNPFTASELSGDVSTSGSNVTSLAANVVTSAKTAVVNTRRTCIIDNDTQSATALVAANFSGRCVIPAASTIVEVDVAGGTGVLTGSAAAPTVSGTGSIQLGKYTPNGGASTTGLLSAALATVSGKACALTAISGTCINGNTSSGTITISTTALAAGDALYVSAATADAAQTWYNIAIIYTVN